MYVLGAALFIKLADWWFTSQQGVQVKEGVLPIPPGMIVLFVFVPVFLCVLW